MDLNDLYAEFKLNIIYDKFKFDPIKNGFVTNAGWADVKNNLRSFQLLAKEQNSAILCDKFIPELKGSSFKIMEIWICPESFLVRVSPTEKIKKVEKALRKLEKTLKMHLGVVPIKVELYGWK